MEYREFGKTAFKLPIFGMGTYYDPGWIAAAKLLKMKPRSEMHLKAINTGLDQGINFIDTAEIYGTEPLIAKAIAGRKRDELFIATKVWRSNLDYDSVIKSCNRSLKNLQTSYIDLYQIHFPNKRIKISETMRAMEYLVKEGKIRHIGISNFSLRQMLDAEETLKTNELASTQMPYSLVDGKIEKDILPHCRDTKIAVLAYYPLGHGKLGSENAFLSAAVADISRNHGGKSLSQIALNWFYSKNENVFPIPRASNPEHVSENVGSVGWRLSIDEISRLEGAISRAK
ncbi:MAG: aldo/keto reductase [Thermoplasmata archaeon]